MRRDFTLNIYERELLARLNKGLSFIRVCDSDANLSMRRNAKRFVVLRQDVDRLPGNSLSFARIQKELGIRSTFYFRSVSGSFDQEIIQEIAGMGHEIGYHYEDLSLVAKRHPSTSSGTSRGGKYINANAELGTRNAELLFEAAIESFGRNLEEPDEQVG